MGRRTLQGSQSHAERVKGSNSVELKKSYKKVLTK